MPNTVTSFRYYFARFLALASLLLFTYVCAVLSGRALLEWPTQTVTTRRTSSTSSRIIEKPDASFVSMNIKVCDRSQEPNVTAMLESKYNVPLTVEEEKFTVLILTYNRKEALYNALQNYAEMAKAGQIIVLWNDDNREPPDIEKDINFTVPFLIKVRPNRLSTRFLPLDEIMYQGK